MADQPATPPALPALPPVERRHLDALTDAIGIVHGARGSRPDPATGHCTDDAARALQVDLLHERELGEDALAASIARDLDLLAASLDPASGRFRHLRRRDGTWLDDAGTELAHGRTMLALGETMGAAASRSVRRTAAGLFERGLPAADDLLGLRARAAVVLGCEAAARAGWEGATRSTYRRFSEQLARQFEGLDDDWPWPRDTLGSESALPARALIVAGRRFASSPMVATGLRGLDWLLGVQAGAGAHLSLIADRGWTRGAERPRYDQRPLEAASLLLAAEAAFFVTREPRYRASMEQAFAWFLGANDGGVPIAIAASGSCHDGLGPTGPLPDEGAEATLMWHLALEHVRRLRRHAPAVSGPAPSSGRHAGRHAARRAVTGAIDG